MWVERIAIENFGAVRHLRIKGLGPRVNVLYGPNEAGKSTVLEFVRSAFFGFRKKTGRQNIYEPEDGLLRGGWLVVRTGTDTRLRVSRTERRGQREGWLEITDEQGTEIHAASTELFGNGLDRSAYENLFAFDLDGMRTLDRSTLRGKILSAALGSVSVSPLDVLKKADERCKRIVKRPRREGDCVASVQVRLRDVDRRLRELSDRPQHYVRVKNELEEVRAERAAIVGEIGAAEESLRKLEDILRYEEDGKRLVEVERNLVGVADVKGFPHDGVIRLEQAMERRREAQSASWEAERNLEHLREQVEKLLPDEEILEHRSEIRLLNNQARRLAGRPEEIDRLRARIVRLEGILHEEMSSLGANWNRERVAQLDPSIVLEQEIRVFVDSWRGRRQRIQVLQQSYAEALERCAGTESEVQRIQALLAETSRGCRGYLPPESLGKLQEWKFHHSTISTLQERLSGEERRAIGLVGDHKEVTRRRDALQAETSSIISAGLFWLLMALLGTAAGGTLASAWVASGSGTWIFLIVGMCLSLAVLASIRWKVLWERRRGEKLASEAEELSGKLALLAREIAHVEQTRRAIAAKIRDLETQAKGLAHEALGNPLAGLNDVLRAEALARAAEEPMRKTRALEDALRTASDRLHRADEQRKAVESDMRKAELDFQKLVEEWDPYLMERGLDPGLEPETALSVVTRLRGIKGRLHDLEAEEKDLEELRREWTDFCARVEALARRMGKPEVAGASPLGQLHGWMRAEVDSQRAMAEKNSLSERIREQELHLGVLLQRLREAENEIAGLLNAAAVTDEESFRERAALHERYKLLEQERRLLVSTLTTGLGLDNGTEMGDGIISIPWADHKKAAEELSERVRELRQRSDELADLSGRLAQEIASLELEDEVELLLNEREVLMARLGRLSREWVVTRLSSILLRKTLRRYECEKQPKVLERGSETFRTVTGGMFGRILFSLEEDRVKVERADGSIADEHVLSRATLEQVYLSLRLAHLETFPQNESMPVLLDDVLVNFDGLRAQRTVEALVQFSERTDTQILFFTCHSRLADLFPETAVRICLDGLPTGRGRHTCETEDASLRIHRV